MADDIFDKAAKAQPKGDVFDQAAATIEIPDPVKQAQAFTRSQIKPLIPGTGTVDPSGGLAEAQKSPEYQEYMKASGQMAAGTAGGMAGGALVAPLVPGAAEAGGAGRILPWILSKLTSTSGAGVGAGVGTMVSGATPREALETAAGGTMAGMAIEGTAAGASKVAKSKLVKGLTKSKVTEMEEAHTAQAAEAEKAYQKQLAGHKEKVQAVKDKYAAQLQEHSLESKTASAKQSAAEAKTGAALEHQNDLAGLLKENLELADKKIAAELGKEFEKVSDAVASKNPKVLVTDAEREARGKLYFPDSVSAFNKIMENVSGKLKMTDYSILRKAYSNLNDILYGGGELPSDLYGAVKTVRDSLGKDLQGAAEKTGLGGKYSKAMKDWHEYKDTWADKSSIAKGGSPIRRILDSEDPAFVIDQLKGKAGQRLLEDIGKYQKYGADKALAGRLKGFIEQVRAMPSSAGEIPRIPERPEFPKAPERTPTEPFNQEDASRKILIDRLKKYGGIGAGVAGGELLYKLLFGGKSGGASAPLP